MTAPWSGADLFSTSVVGSYSVPEWLERLKTDYYQRRISAGYLREIHEAVIKAALKDQERAAINVVSDGELRRDNDIDYFLARINGLEIAKRSKAFYYDYYDVSVTKPLPEDDKAMGLVDLANEDLKKGRFVSTQRKANEALAGDPKNADAYAVLGAAAWRAGQARNAWLTMSSATKIRIGASTARGISSTMKET